MTASKKKISAGFAAALLFIGFLLPVIAFGLINAFFAEQKKVAEMREFAALADSAAQQLEPRCENAEFWCHELNRMFAETGKAGEFKTSLQKLADKHQQKISWILWDAGNRVIDKNITSQHTDAIWNRVGGILRSASEVWFRLMGRDDDAFIRSILGEHVQTKTFSRATFRSNPTLNSLSFSRPAGRFWADFNEHMGAIVIFPPGIDGKSHGIKEFLNGFDLNSTGIVLGNEEFFFSNMPDKTPETLASLKIDLADRTPEILHTQKEIYTGRYVGRNLFFCLFRPDTGRYSTNGNTLLFSAVLAFLWVLILNKIFHERLNTGLSIRYIVFGIITCSNIFPLLIMGILGQQYLEQKRHILIEEQRSEAVNFLKQIEGEFVAETHKIKNFAIKHINKLGETLQHESMSLENTGDFRKKMAQVSGKFMVVASTTIPTLSDAAFLGPEKSVLLGDENHQSLWFVETSDKETMDRIKLNETMSKCGAAFIAFYNGTSLSDQLLTEVEIIIEALFQAKLNATFHSFLRVLDHVENVGLGTEKHPTFMQFLSFNPSRLADYLFMFHFNIGIHARNYMNKMHSLLQGNSHGIKAVYSTGVNLKNLKIAPFANQLEFRELFSKQTYFPQPSAEFVEIAGRKWIASGFVSKVIADTTLIALSPTEEIQRRLSLEKRQLLGIMLINVLLVAGITLIFVQTILKPVYQLQNATDAIRSRNFSFRIPELGKDEFGKMSRIFNSALGDLQEMSLARDVQQQLFPKQQIETGQYDLFSKTLTMADLGGDYLDVFPLDSDRFIMVLGDVAGHGVGAAMIMAMAKSAMLNSTEILDRPTELLNRLHALIYRTKSKKQKKIMTFQYVMVDTREHKITFANAGGCSPYLVRSKDKTVEEIMLPGAALGSFKNARFNQLEIILEPGDTLVLYTDGLVESRNDHGEELGYQNFKSMLLENHCVGSQQYFDRIMLANQIWRQSQPPQDDFSLMILGRRPC